MALSKKQSTAGMDELLPNMEISERLAEEQRKALHVAKQRKQRRRPVTFGRVFCVGVMIALCVAMVSSQMQLTKMTDEISKKETELGNLESQFVALKTRQEQTLNLSYVENYAQNVLGMVKMDASQIEYVEMASPDLVEVNSQGAAVEGAVSGLMRSFTAVLEYLK